MYTLSRELVNFCKLRYVFGVFEILYSIFTYLIRESVLSGQFLIYVPAMGIT